MRSDNAEGMGHIAFCTLQQKLHGAKSVKRANHRTGAAAEPRLVTAPQYPGC
jgi:hypothetical protein